MNRPKSKDENSGLDVPPIVLAVSQSTPHCSITVMRNGKTLGSISWDSKMINNHDIFKVLPKVLAESAISVSNIELFGVDIGPGSFAGIRTAISTLNGMALPDRKQVIGISCGMAIAHDILSQNPGHSVLIVGDARRKSLWYAEFQLSNGRTCISKDYALTTNELFIENISPGTLIATPDWQRLDAFLSEVTPSHSTLINRQSTPKAETIAHLALLECMPHNTDAKKALPLYMHPPVAVASK